MIVGLTQRVFYHNGQAYDSTDQAWYHFLKDHEIVTVKNDITQDFNSLADQLDLLILTGGNDPAVRRITETKLASAMLAKQKPVLGVCHGAFLLTELLEGVVLGDYDEHYNTEHLVMVSGEMHHVNSFHSLRIVHPPKTATVLATDMAGFPEAWIDGTLAAVVWHPERMAEPFLPEEIQNLTNLKFQG